MTTEIDRIKILEGKISQVVDYVNRLGAENEKLRLQLKEFKAERKELEDQGKRVARLDEELKRSEAEREAVRGRIEALIAQIDQLGI